MNQSLKNIIVSLSSILFLFFSATQIGESCGYDITAEQYRVSFFIPEVLRNSAFFPFHYTSKIINSTASPFETDRDRNLKLWQKQVGKTISLQDIDAVLYNTSSDSVVNAYEEKTLLQTFPSNDFIEALLQPANKGLLEYLVLAKKNEFVNFMNNDPWEFYDEASKDQATTLRNAIIREIEKQLSNSQLSAFLKQRYAYQLVLNYRYQGQPQKATAAFQQYFDLNNSQDLITAWATFHAAACVSNSVLANYYLALAFERSDSKKAQAHVMYQQQFHAQTLQMAKNNYEKATLLAIAEVNNPAPKLEVIQEIHKLAPEHRVFPLLVQREINKIEDWLLTPTITGLPSSISLDENDDFYGYGEYEYINDEYVKVKENEPQMLRNEIGWETNYFKLKNYQKDLDYTRKFRAFLETALQTAPDVKLQDLLRLAIAHLHFIEGNYSLSLQLNSQVSEKASTKMLVQKHINLVLLLPKTGKDLLATSTKAELYQSLQWLQEHLGEFSNANRTVSQLHLYLSRQYFNLGDKVTAALLHRKTIYTGAHEYRSWGYYQDISFLDRFGTVNDVQNAINLLKKSNKTDFEKYLLVKNTPQEKKAAALEDDFYYYYGDAENYNFEQQLLDLQGTIAFRQDNLNQALSSFSKLPVSYWETVYDYQYYITQSPFQAPVFLSNSITADTIKCDKTFIIKALIQLKAEAERTPTAVNLWKVGNAYYNFTYWGNSWMMFNYGRYMDEFSGETGYGYTFHPNANKYFSEYYACSRAVKYYQKAIEVEGDKEAKSRAAFMLAWCDDISQEANYLKKNRYYSSVPMPNSSLLYKQWKQGFASTNTYKSLMMSCTDLAAKVN